MGDFRLGLCIEGFLDGCRLHDPRAERQHYEGSAWYAVSRLRDTLGCESDDFSFFALEKGDACNGALLEEVGAADVLEGATDLKMSS